MDSFEVKTTELVNYPSLKYAKYVQKLLFKQNKNSIK